MKTGNIEAIRNLAVPKDDIRSSIREIQERSTFGVNPASTGYYDSIVPAKDMMMSSYSGQMAGGTNGGLQPLRETAHKQLAAKMRIPWAYYSRLLKDSPYMLATNVNHWLWHEDNGKRKFLVRHDLADGQPTIRAILSEMYKRIDHIEVISELLPILDDGGYTIKAAWTTDDGELNIRAVSPVLIADVKVGDTVQGGILISNSEVGLRSLNVEPYVYRCVCSNGLVVPVSSTEFAFRKIHKGGVIRPNNLHAYRNETLFETVVKHITDGAWTNTFDDMVGVMRIAADEPVRPTTVLDTINRVDPAVTLSEPELALFKTHLEKALETDPFGCSVYMVANCVTRTAQDVEAFTRSTELEKFGATVMRLGSKDFKLAPVTA
tara:strand:- start:27 stop:1160 length:1134 start_codon:yes stop_codon:yes gene_type:complete